MTNIDNVIKGKQNQASGRMFEKFLEEACFYYWLAGQACIEKTPEPMVPVKPYGGRKTGQFIAYYSRQAQPDFKGVLAGGRCIIFDAKHTINDLIRQSAVSESQREMFDKYEYMGAVCCIVVSLAQNDFYRVPWKIWKNMKEEFGHMYMSRKELEPYRVPMKGMEILFLEGMEVDDLRA